MSWSLNIGRVAGTVVRVHLTFLLFLAWIFAASYAQGGAATAWDSLAFMVLLFLCVLLHEFGHPAGVVRRQRHLDGLVDVEPLRMMIHFLGHQRRPRHEAEGLVEILEREFLGNRVAAGNV